MLSDLERRILLGAKADLQALNRKLEIFAHNRSSDGVRLEMQSIRAWLEALEILLERLVNTENLE